MTVDELRIAIARRLEGALGPLVGQLDMRRLWYASWREFRSMRRAAIEAGAVVSDPLLIRSEVGVPVISYSVRLPGLVTAIVVGVDIR